MERRNLALLCAGVLCFWLFALAVGTAQGAGLRGNGTGSAGGCPGGAGGGSGQQRAAAGMPGGNPHGAGDGPCALRESTG